MIDQLSATLIDVGSIFVKLRARGPIKGKWADATQFRAEADRIAHDRLLGALAELTP